MNKGRVLSVTDTSLHLKKGRRAVMLCKLNFDLLVPFLCCFEVALEKMQAFFLSLKGNNKINDYFTSCIHFLNKGINKMMSAEIDKEARPIFKNIELK